MGHVRSDAFVHVRTANSICMESSCLGCFWAGSLPWLDGKFFMGAMVCTCCTYVDWLIEHRRYVCICDAIGLVVETLRRFVYLASAQLANA